MHMFCFQCQETSEGRGCTSGGVCGKSEETANYQDLLVDVLRGIAIVERARRAASVGVESELEARVHRFVVESLYSTITNTNFDGDRIFAAAREGLALKRALLDGLPRERVAALPDCARFDDDSEPAMRSRAYTVGVLQTEDVDVRALREMTTYGLKGVCAYATHAAGLGAEVRDLGRAVLAALASSAVEGRLDALLETALGVGQLAVASMDKLDRAHAAVFGEPGATRVNLGVRGRPGILVSGHDLVDLQALLEQAAPAGVDVYTHGEMISAHYYPRLRAFGNLVGNYGNSWWRQDVEFERFRGPILMTSNCITPPAESYRDRLFTTGVAGYPGVRHLDALGPDGRKDFRALVALAQRCPPPEAIDEGERWGGFGHAQLVAHAPKLLELVQAGKVRRLVVIGGCDGRELSREYYRELALELPRDTLILSAGCTKYMFFKLDLGEIEGVPRVLDAGQCNDCYSLVAFALQLQKTLGLADVNQLPLAINVAWYDQKAVAVLLALMHLGFKGFRLGPTLPAFLSPRVRALLAERWDLKGIRTAREDAA